MRVCLQCTSKLSDKKWICPTCGWHPYFIDSLPLLAPSLTSGFPDYPPDAHKRRVHLEAKSFWFFYRNQLINHALDFFFQKRQSFLEIGCGTGFVLSGIAQFFPEIELFGAEAYPSALKFAKERVEKAEFAQMDIHHLPFIDEFDVIGVFDVLEHLDNDIHALKEIHKALKVDGGLIITVPQHKWLWSAIDAKSGHKRRYTRKDIRYKIRSTGFKVIFITSFILLLLPFMAASRWIKEIHSSHDPNKIQNELGMYGWLNGIFKKICSHEAILIKNGHSLPIGGSLLCIAKKCEYNE